MLTAIVGINWGDEGKGRMVDLLSADYQVIIRYQGGNNAGHTVVNNKGKFILNLLPSGILRDDTVNVMGNGMVVDIEHLSQEIKTLQDKDIKITPANLKISDKAVICLPYHKQLDVLEEDRLKDAKFGSTRRGIGPVYGDKYLKKAIRMNDLRDRQALREKVESLSEWKDLLITGYGAAPIDREKFYQWLCQYGDIILPYVCDTTAYLQQAINNGKNLLFEAQLGALRDIDFGIYPYTTSSSTIAAYAPIGSGIPFKKIEHTIGIIKAYSSCVGEGPFAAELFGDQGEMLRQAGDEYGAATGRPRRVGGIDLVASRYGCLMQGADELAMTKLDVLSCFDQIPVCTAYQLNGEIIKDFFTDERLNKAKPVYQYLPGFKQDISHCRKPEDLPKEAREYIAFIEDAVQTPIKYVSVGANREDYLIMK